jgi:hypothetical protein
MHIRKLLAIVLLGLSLSAVADFTTITAAYEVAVSDLRMPLNEGGTLKFRQCAECAWQTLLVNSSTVYVLDGNSVQLAEFKEQLESIADPSAETATVLHHLESNVITGIKVRL